MMKLIVDFGVFYGLYAFTAAMLIWRYGVKDRAPFIVVAWLIPVLTIAALLNSILRLILGKRPKIGPCPYGLDEAEVLIERHRREMFGGGPIVPHFAQDWTLLYKLTLEEEA